jgi:hypothetical protein
MVAAASAMIVLMLLSKVKVEIYARPGCVLYVAVTSKYGNNALQQATVGGRNVTIPI